MKTTFKLLLPVLLVILLVAATGDKPAGRIATIDLRHVFDRYYLREQAMKAVELEQADIQKKLKSMQDEGQKLVDDRNKLAKDMSDPMITAQQKDALKTRLDEKTQEIEAKRNEIQTYGQRAQDQLLLKEDHVKEQLLKDIRTAVDAKAKKADYSLVIDTAAAIYSNGDNDITDEILKQMNAAAPTAPLADPPKSTNSAGKK